MNFGPLIFIGVFFTLALSWLGVIVGSHVQIGRQGMIMIQPTNERYPVPRPGQAQQGSEVYRANGCFYCHTQQVRGIGGDIERDWGKRFSVAHDYLYEQPVMLWTTRLGPDLKNVGRRIPDAAWHYLHLYDPRLVVPGSTMPRYEYLFVKRKAGPQPSPDALRIPNLERGIEVVPTPEARALVAYLLSSRAETSLFEAPLPAGSAEDAAPVEGQAGESTAAP
jgi:cytochrome c oxidase cbb3-type subunit II